MEAGDLAKDETKPIDRLGVDGPYSPQSPPPYTTALTVNTMKHDHARHDLHSNCMYVSS